LVNVCIGRNLKIQVHTNGSLRSSSWWQSLGEKLSAHIHDIWFGIDGIGETHEIYRQATNYNKIIENAKAFIEHGGFATWQFIPYEHNQHQIMAALRESQNLSFKKFKLVTSFRNKTTVKHWKTGQEFELKAASNLGKMIKMPNKKLQPTSEDCMHLSPMPSIYLNAQGNLSWCCYRNDKNDKHIQDVLESGLQFDHPTCVRNCGKKESV